MNRNFEFNPCNYGNGGIEKFVLCFDVVLGQGPSLQDQMDSAGFEGLDVSSVKLINVFVIKQKL